MRAVDLLPLLNGVQSRGTKTIAECPAHQPDRNPSLSICDGERGVLLKCWAGCSLQDVCKALRITPQDLFFDELDTDPQKRKAAAQQREAQRREHERETRKLGRCIDACKAAERYLDSRQPVDISAWSHDRLDRELNLIADAFRILEADPYAAC